MITLNYFFIIKTYVVEWLEVPLWGGSNEGFYIRLYGEIGNNIPELPNKFVFDISIFYHIFCA